MSVCAIIFGGSWRETKVSGEDPVFGLSHPGAVWFPGVVGGVVSGVATGVASLDSNRVEVLRLALSALCEPLYSAAEIFDHAKHAPWCKHARSTQEARKKHARNTQETRKKHARSTHAIRARALALPAPALHS